MGTREAGFASSLPGYHKFENAQDRPELAVIWGIDESRIPVKRGLAYPDIVEAAVTKKIRALWIATRKSSDCGATMQWTSYAPWSRARGWVAAH